MDPPAWTWIVTFLLGAAVGFTELISRYRDNPWRAARKLPGTLFILFNGAAAVAAFFLMRHFHLDRAMGLSDDLVAQVLVAGTGAMVVIRSKVFTIRQPGGTDVAVGPAVAVDTFLSVVNREVDRRLAAERNRRVAEFARVLSGYSFTSARQFLLGALSAFQDMDEAAAKRLREDFRALVEDQQFRTWTDEDRYFLAGFGILTEFGDAAFESLFSALQARLQHGGQPPQP